jgi:hypothetical protein
LASASNVARRRRRIKLARINFGIPINSAFYTGISGIKSILRIPTQRCKKSTLQNNVDHGKTYKKQNAHDHNRYKQSHSFGGFDMSKQEEMYRQLQNQKAIIAAQGNKEIRVNEAKNESDYKHLKTAVNEGYKHVTNDQGGNTQENENTLKLYIGDKEFTVENIRKKVKSGDTKFITTMLEANPDMLPGERSYTEIKYDPKNRVYTNEDGETLLGESDILNAYGISQLEESAFNLNDYLKAKGLK